MYGYRFQISRMSITAGVALLAIVALALVLFGGVSRSVQAGGSQTLGCFDTVSNTCGNNGTTTPTYFGVGGTQTATTSVTAFTLNATSLDIDLWAVASSSSSVIQFSVQYSDNGIDWYSQDTSSVSSSLTTHATAPMLHAWTPGTTATTSRNLTITPIASRYVKIGFQAQVASTSLYARIIPRNLIPN